MTVEVDDVANLNQYLDIALANGINQVDNVQLKVRDEAKYQQQARMAAIEDAKLKARSIAKGFKRNLGGVWRVDYNTMNPQPVMMRAMSMNEKWMPAIPIRMPPWSFATVWMLSINLSIN